MRNLHAAQRTEVGATVVQTGNQSEHGCQDMLCLSVKRTAVVAGRHAEAAYVDLTLCRLIKCQSSRPASEPRLALRTRKTAAMKSSTDARKILCFSVKRNSRDSGRWSACPRAAAATAMLCRLISAHLRAAQRTQVDATYAKNAVISPSTDGRKMLCFKREAEQPRLIAGRHARGRGCHCDALQADQVRKSSGRSANPG